MITEPRCHQRSCRHLIGVEGREPEQKVVCIAYPEGIPNDIAYGLNLHLVPNPGDHGVQYEKEP